MGVARCLRYAPGAILIVAATAGVCSGLVQGIAEALAPAGDALSLWRPPSSSVVMPRRSLLASAVAMMVAMAITQIGTGLIAVAVSRAVLGRHSDLADCLAGVRGRVRPLAGVAAVMLGLTIAIGVGAACLMVLGTWTGAIGSAIAIIAVGCLLVAGVYVSVHIALAPVAVVLEGVSAKQALIRAWSLATGSAWRILGISLLTALAAMVVSIAPSILIGIPLALVSTVGGVVMGVVATTLISGVTFIIALPIAAEVLALLYVDLRIRKESLGPILDHAARQGLPPDGSPQ
jgi:hypothetical protein